MIDFITYDEEKLPIRISYSAIKRYELETKKPIGKIDESIENLEILLYYGLMAGHKAEKKELSFEREDMEWILDECLEEFNNILTGSFQTPTEGGSSGKKN